MKKAQSSTEFFVLAGTAIFFFFIFFVAVQNNIKEKSSELINLKVKDVALSVQDEISLASTASEGYRRDFIIPQSIESKPYEITITEDFVYVKTEDEKFSIALPVVDVIGDVQIGDNFIAKIGGKIYINTLPLTGTGFSPVGEEEEQTSTSFIRGDANADGTLDISDSIFIKDYVNGVGQAPTCLKTADANNDGIIQLIDAQYLDEYLFSGGPEPAQPYPICGTDLTEDALSCDSYIHCQEVPEQQPTPIPTGTPLPSPTGTPTPLPSPSSS